jgi:formate hydrogenlyase transcriptional activator
LQNFIERSVIVSNGPLLNGSLSDLTYATKASAPVTLEQAQSAHILQTLLRTEGVVGGPNGAAACLGLKRTTLISMMRRLGINPGRSLTLPARSVVSVA